MATSTVQNVIDEAIERASLNDSSLIPTDQTIDYINHFQRRVYMIAAEMNPDYFGSIDTVTRASDTDDWDVSSLGPVQSVEVDSITGSLSDVSAGDQVNIADVEEPDMVLSPRVLLRNFQLIEYGSDLSEDASNYVDGLKIYNSEYPTELTATADNPDIPEEWLELLSTPLAHRFAIRDQRFDEAQLINQEYKELLQLFRRHVQVYDHGAQKSLQSLKVPTTMDFAGGGEG